MNFSKQVFATNALPKVEDTSDGFCRRWIFFQFPYKFDTTEIIESMRQQGKDVSKLKPKRPDILEEICTPQEFSGLLNRAIESINEVWARRAFTTSKSSEDTALFWVRKSDSFLAFALENVVQNPEAYVLKESIRKAYQYYCKKNKIAPEGDKHIAKIMQTHFGASETRKLLGEKQEYAWEGAQLKDILL